MYIKYMSIWYKRKCQICVLFKLMPITPMQLQKGLKIATAQGNICTNAHSLTKFRRPSNISNDVCMLNIFQLLNQFLTLTTSLWYPLCKLNVIIHQKYIHVSNPISSEYSYCEVFFLLLSYQQRESHEASKITTKDNVKIDMQNPQQFCAHIL